MIIRLSEHRKLNPDGSWETFRLRFVWLMDYSISRVSTVPPPAGLEFATGETVVSFHNSPDIIVDECPQYIMAVLNGQIVQPYLHEGHDTNAYTYEREQWVKQERERRRQQGDTSPITWPPTHNAVESKTDNS